MANGSFGISKVRRQPITPMIIQPKAPVPPPVKFLEPLPLACCARCTMWDRERLNQNDPQFQPVAECRRFPPRLMLLPVPMDPAALAQMRLNPRIAGQFPPGAVPMTQQLRPVRDATPADCWCGEFDPMQTPIADAPPLAELPRQ